MDRPRLKQAATAITAAYKEGRFGGALQTVEARMAYLLTRLPATYAANRVAMGEMAVHMPRPQSLLDLGAGTGAAMWAAREIWPSLRQFQNRSAEPD